MNLIKLIFLVKSKVSALTREEEREKTIPYLYIENKFAINFIISKSHLYK